MFLAENPRCYWCGCIVHDCTPKDGEVMCPTGATVDHLQSRYFRVKGHKSPKVLACYKCNTDRGSEETKIKLKNGWTPKDGSMWTNSG